MVSIVLAEEKTIYVFKFTNNKEKKPKKLKKKNTLRRIDWHISESYSFAAKMTHILMSHTW